MEITLNIEATCINHVESLKHPKMMVSRQSNFSNSKLKLTKKSQIIPILLLDNSISVKKTRSFPIFIDIKIKSKTTWKFSTLITLQTTDMYFMLTKHTQHVATIFCQLYVYVP